MWYARMLVIGAVVPALAAAAGCDKKKFTVNHDKKERMIFMLGSDESDADDGSHQGTDGDYQGDDGQGGQPSGK